MSDFTHLHVHSYYSLMDGLNSPAELLDAAKDLGQNAIALTDHGTLSSHRDLQVAARERGMKPILGLEAYISPTDRFDKRQVARREDNTQLYNHIILIAKDARGYKNLNKLSELAWSEGYYYKPRIDRDLLAEYKEGLYVLSGCMNGLISKEIERENFEKADQLTKWFADEFGSNFYMEVQAHNPPGLNHNLLRLADKYGIKPIATSDCHFAKPEQRAMEEAMLILSTSPKFPKDLDFEKSRKIKDIFERFDYLYPDRPISFADIDVFVDSRENIREGFMEQGIDRDDIFDSTLEVTDGVGDYEFHEGLDLLPRPKTGNPDDILEKKAWKGLEKRGFKGIKEYEDRLREELDIIKSMDFSTYFLIVENKVSWARGQGIRVGPGRGSAAGSLVCYALRITDVDPIKYGLLFFRFINPERGDFPDVDTDYMDKRRGEVKDYVTRKFKHVASIATYNRFGGKNSVKDAARVFRVPVAEVNRALKGIDAPPDKYDLFWEQFNRSDKAKEFGKKYPEVINLAKFLQGRIRGGGMHAAGLVMAKEPLSNFAPMETAKDTQDDKGPRIPLVAMDMEQVADLGLIKLDALGLKTLSIIDDTLKLIKERHDRDIDLNQINLEDKNIYSMLSEGYTKGVFQCEAVPYTSLLINMGGVWSFNELAASNALVRPGAMNTIGAEYIARKNGKADVSYPHVDMVPFTKETYGEVLYQEQVMLTMTELAGMSMADADKVRKIIGKKKDVKEFDAYKDKFLEGASKKIHKSFAEKLWQDFEAHAGYSFNKSHAVAYSLLSYWTAWLKYYYPKEFMVSVLNNEGDKDALTEYLIEAKRLGIKVLLPHVNKSEVDFTIEGDGIRFGLKNIKYISAKTGALLKQYGPYQTYQQLYDKVMEKGSGLNARVISSLNAIGGAELPGNPRRGDERDNFYEYLKIPAFNTKAVPPKIQLQFRTLDEYEEKGCFVILGMVRKIKTGEGWSRVELVDETGTAGIFTGENTPIETGQMYAMLIADNRIARFATIDEVANKERNVFVEYLYRDHFPSIPDGMRKVVAFKSRTTKAGKRMADIVFSTNDKQLESVLVFPSMYVKAFSKCKEGAVVDAVIKETKDGARFLDNVL